MDRGSGWGHLGTIKGWSWGHWGLVMEMAASLSLKLPLSPLLSGHSGPNLPLPPDKVAFAGLGHSRLWSAVSVFVLRRQGLGRPSRALVGSSEKG